MLVPDWGLYTHSSQLRVMNVVRTQPPGIPIKVELGPCHASTVLAIGYRPFTISKCCLKRFSDAMSSVLTTGTPRHGKVSQSAKLAGR